jgi:hypothetical protein
MDSEDVYAFDSDVVHKAGNETITGVKTFQGNGRVIYVRNPAVTYNQAPSNYIITNIAFTDKDGQEIGGVESIKYTDNSTGTRLVVRGSDGDYNIIEIGRKANGQAYVSCPTPTDTTQTNSIQVATVGWVNSVGNNVMHLTDYENITGYKSFQTNIEFDSPNMTQGTNGSGYGIEFYDKNSNRFGFLRPQAQTNANVLSLCATRVVNGQIQYAAVEATVDSSGNCYVKAPASDVNGSIVTTVNKSKAANGYFQLGNGLIIQWGKSTTTNSEAKITLPKAFTTTNYAVVGNSTQALGNASNRYLTGWAQVIARTTTNFTMYMSNFENSYWWNDVEKPFTWIAIGY